MLMTLGDFAEFKELMLHHKSELQGSGSTAARLDGLLSMQQNATETKAPAENTAGTAGAAAAAASPDSPTIAELTGKMQQAATRDESKWDLSP